MVRGTCLHSASDWSDFPIWELIAAAIMILMWRNDTQWGYIRTWSAKITDNHPSLMIATNVSIQCICFEKDG
jgi:hypothetical protein